MGLVRGRLPSERRATATRLPRSATRPADLRRSSRTSSSRRFETQPAANSSNQGFAIRSIRSASRWRHRPVGLQGRLHPAPRAVPVLRLDREPAPSDDPYRQRPGTTRSRVCRDRRDTQSYVSGVPQFNTPNHQYDLSDFDQLVAAITRRPAAAIGAAGGQLPQGTGIRGRPRRLLRAGRRAGVRRRRGQCSERSPDWRSTVVIVD